MSKQGRVLVIGTSKSYRGERSFAWQQAEEVSDIPLIGDFDVAIIYLPSLKADTYDEPYDFGPIAGRMNKMIEDALKGNTRVYLITAPSIDFGDSYTYSMIPFSLDVHNESGTNFKVKDDKEFPYLSHVKSWSVCFKGYPSELRDWDFTVTSGIYARTNHEKNVSFFLRFENDKRYAGSITIVPPIEDVNGPSESLTIERLLASIAPVSDKDQVTEEALSTNARELLLGTEEELLNEKQNAIATIDKAKARSKEIDDELGEYIVYKGIVGLKGKALEQSVSAVLKRLGMEFALTGTNKEDGNLQFDEGWSVPVEIKGHENRGSSEGEVRQVIVRLKDETADREVRGILIVNPYFGMSSEEIGDKKTFEPSVVEQAKVFKILLIDTRILLKYLADQLKYGESMIVSALSTGSGVMKYEPFTPKK